MMLHNVEVGLLSALIIFIVPHIKIYYLCRKGNLFKRTNIYQHRGHKFTKALIFMMLHNVEVGLLSALIIFIVPHIKIYYLCR